MHPVMTYQQFTQKRINDVLNANAKNLKSVHNDLIKNTNTPLNSLNLFVGKKGSGKTVTAIKEIIKISENSPETHMLIYINKTGTQHDKVFEELKHLIDIPILYCSWQNAVEALEKSIISTINQYFPLDNQSVFANNDVCLKKFY